MRASAELDVVVSSRGDQQPVGPYALAHGSERLIVSQVCLRVLPRKLDCFFAAHNHDALAGYADTANRPVSLVEVNEVWLHFAEQAEGITENRQTRNIGDRLVAPTLANPHCPSVSSRASGGLAERVRFAQALDYASCLIEF